LTDNGGEEVRGAARRVEITVESDEFLMIDDAVLEQGSNRFNNDRIIYNRSKAIVRAGTSAQGKKRVQVVIEPKQQEAVDSNPEAAEAPGNASAKVPPTQ
jgi:lipopolysaccharide export system protein LptA